MAAILCYNYKDLSAYPINGKEVCAMSSKERFASVQTAQVVTERLVAVVRHPDSFIEIDVVKPDAENSMLYPPLYLAPTDEDVSVCEDESEIIECITREGLRARVLVGKPATRKHHAAEIILGPREDSDT